MEEEKLPLVMRAYEDGNRLVISIENPDTGIKELILNLLNRAGSTVKTVDLLEEPSAAESPKEDISKLKKIAEAEVQAKAEKIQESSCTGSETIAPGKDASPDINSMDVFALRSFILNNRERFSAEAARLFKTDDIDFVVCTKSEKDLRRLAETY